MDFIIGIPISIDLKGDKYNSIWVIFDRQTKIVYYKLVKVKFYILSRAKVIIDMMICHYRVLESIVTDWDFLFILQF